MRIQRMRATFGKLEDQTLELQPGLNIIEGGNEAGKTTWMGFLMAMLYGVETKERAKNGKLPDKTRFQPWNGRAMQGSMEICTADRRITLERSSGTVPMGDFQAWDSDTGTALETLTGKTCGQTLLGVEAAVYARSGYLLQKQLPVSSDANLEKRLSALVTAGREDYAFAEVDDKLKKMQNAIQHAPSGSLPRTKEALSRTERRLSEIAERSRRLSELETRLHQCKEERSACKRILAGINALEQTEKQGRLLAAQAALDAAVEDRLGWEAVCSELPEEERLQALQRELQQLQNDLQKAALEDGLQVSGGDLPAPDPVFGRMSAQQAHDKTAEDAETVRQAQIAHRPLRSRPLFWLLPLLLGLALSVVGAVLPILVLALLGAALSLGCLIGWVCQRILGNRRVDEYLALQNRARAILAEYQTNTVKGIVRRGITYIRAVEDSELTSSNSENRARMEALAKRRDDLFARIEALMPGCGTAEKANILFQEASQSRMSLDRARLLEEQRAQQLEDLRFALGTVQTPGVDAERYAEYDREDKEEQLEALEQQIESLTSEADQLSGAIGQMGDILSLRAEEERLKQEIRRLEDRLHTLHLARVALAAADESLRARFAPMLCQKTSMFFQRLTGGKYDRVQLNRELQITVQAADSAVFRSIAYLSGGTVDQLYLALRLAICDLLLPDAPIVLDDVLVYFDDERALLALETLREMSKSRQILLFTCQNREKRLLNTLDAKQGGEKA
ncbi:MAG: AAA family ATPase [Oscillospiraceae bacterium]|nr:AAA family ATPase [Oscillospiraceae bacterium]